MEKKDFQIETLDSKIDQLNETINNLNTNVSKFESAKEEREKDYENKIAQLNQVKDNLEKERIRLNDERVKEKDDYFQNMKKLWSEHEETVQQHIKSICQTYLVNYVDKVPFKGSPDNTIEICDEYIIFDAKSPASDDLTNFPKYIKAQTESVKKYAKLENVKKDIFLVIPTNTIDSISQLFYNMSDYNVYVITNDSIEPIILSLKKIEEYQMTGVLGRYIDFRELEQTVSDKLKDQGISLGSKSSPEEIERTRQVMASAEFNSLRDQVQ